MARTYCLPSRLEHCVGGSRPVLLGRRASRPHQTNVGGGCSDLATQAATLGSPSLELAAIGSPLRFLSEKSSGSRQLHTLRARAALVDSDNISTDGAANDRSQDGSKTPTNAFSR